MTSRLGVTALAACLAVQPFAARAEPGLQLNSVSIEFPTEDEQFPPGPGAEVVSNNCLACHSAAMVLFQPKLSKPQWEAEVKKMRATYKAPIDAADTDAIVGYLVGLSSAGQP